MNNTSLRLRDFYSTNKSYLVSSGYRSRPQVIHRCLSLGSLVYRLVNREKSNKTKYVIPGLAAHGRAHAHTRTQQYVQSTVQTTANVRRTGKTLKGSRRSRRPTRVKKKISVIGISYLQKTGLPFQSCPHNPTGHNHPLVQVTGETIGHE